jgi:hypothetical protein
MDEAQAAAYLAGMIDGEGHVGARRNRFVSVSNTDWDLIEAVVKCCELLGLHQTVQRLVVREGRKPGWQVIITGKDALERIRELVPIQSARKQKALDDAIASYKQLPRPPRDWLQKKYLDEGMSLQQVAEAWGAKNSVSAWCWLEYHGIPRREAGGSAKTKYPRPDREWLKARIDEGLTLKQIGDLRGAPLSAVWRWCQHYQIERAKEVV